GSFRNTGPGERTPRLSGHLLTRVNPAVRMSLPWHPRSRLGGTGSKRELDETEDASETSSRVMTEYGLSRFDAEELERARLDLLERFHDPLSTRLFDSIGVSEGWRCLDVGAGGGSSTRLLAQRVGETGSVVATDLDTRLLEPLAGGSVEVWRHDLVADPLP